MGTINYLQAIKPDTAYIRKIIENSLLADWAIRIEYHGIESDTNGWQLWDKTFFALRSADEVVQAIADCYTKQPQCAIRMNASKFRPQSSMLYTVYNPRFVPAEAHTKTQSEKVQMPLEPGQATLQVSLTP